MAGSSKKRRPPSSPSSSKISPQKSKQRSCLQRSSHSQQISSRSEIVQVDDSDLDNTQNSKTSKLSDEEELEASMKASQSKSSAANSERNCGDYRRS
ncbi:hypothetical protein PtA15_4A609 [Puccinia triticina]|uniref:Uncharacterized protein n=1 Tax=Puccinia triticina TaxID=208348 RepID=A0ABY7CI56_9BASI|nr:uncharacterized protein PtA15_4A609 [Puccinia triticina]WAQ84157.1 hypothetical protein PtA15_4A609 [Puccinia triticina]